MVENDTLVWAFTKGYPWWPAYVCDPFSLKNEMPHLDQGVVALLAKARRSKWSHHVVYYFGTHNLQVLPLSIVFTIASCSGIHPESQMKSWGGRDHSTFVGIYPPSASLEMKYVLLFTLALSEVEDYLANDPNSQLPPYLDVPSEDTSGSPAQSPPRSQRSGSSEPSRTQFPPSSVPFESLGWAQPSGFPWLPVYVFDPTKLNPSLHYFGDTHAEDLKFALANPRKNRLVYYFGRRTIGLQENNNIRPWRGPKHSKYERGYPKDLRNANVLVALVKGLREAKEFMLDALVALRTLPSITTEDLAPEDPTRVPHETLAWAKSRSKPWMPVFVCNPWQLDRESHSLGEISIQTLDLVKASPYVFRVVYYFGQRKLGVLSANCEVMRWNCPDHDAFASACRATLQHLIPSPLEDAEAFIAFVNSKREMALPYTSELLDDIPRRNDLNLPWTSNSAVVWGKRKDCPWWPAYICDVSRLRNDLYFLGSDHSPLLARAVENPEKCRLLYYFGEYRFVLNGVNTVQTWGSHRHDSFASPSSQSDWPIKLQNEFAFAMAEAEMFMSKEGNPHRVLPYMIPSDMDKTLPLPPVPPMPSEGLVWALTKGYPWMPAILCNPDKVTGACGETQVMVSLAWSYPTSRWLVYYFGHRSFANHRTRGTIRPWGSEHHDELSMGCIESCLVPDDRFASFDVAMTEALDFQSHGDVARLPGFAGPNEL
ncbi:hypothetical protein AeRB84_015552 [Aphanomyces euteiches]|nr:hypothetical protein AeRB84_015552 [Aphanomyces euteiches]